MIRSHGGEKFCGDTREDKHFACRTENNSFNMEEIKLSNDVIEQIKDFNHEELTEEQNLLINKLISESVDKMSVVETHINAMAQELISKLGDGEKEDELEEEKKVWKKEVEKWSEIFRSVLNGDKSNEQIE